MEIEKARARRKCYNCIEAIKKGEKCLIVWREERIGYQTYQKKTNFCIQCAIKYINYQIDKKIKKIEEFRSFLKNLDENKSRQTRFACLDAMLSRDELV